MKRAEWVKMQIAAAAPRRAEIAMLYLGGCTLQEIGDAIGMTREGSTPELREFHARLDRQQERARQEKAA